MAKETCTTCDVRLDGPVSFCAACGRPTRYATDAERLDWDLHQWRAHVDRSVAAGVHPIGTPNGGMGRIQAQEATAVATQPRREQQVRLDAYKPAPSRFDMPKPQPAGFETPKPEEKKAKREKRSPRIQVPKPHLPRLRRGSAESKPERTVEIDRDHEFAYESCATCEATDWIVRTTRNDDETWNYWCVRCSRSFKTEIKMRQALKPFLSAFIVIGGLLAASFLMLR